MEGKALMEEDVGDVDLFQSKISLHVSPGSFKQHSTKLIMIDVTFGGKFHICYVLYMQERDLINSKAFQKKTQREVFNWFLWLFSIQIQMTFVGFCRFAPME